MKDWICVARHEAMGVGFYEYVNADSTKAKQVWDDGYTEEYDTT